MMCKKIARKRSKSFSRQDFESVLGGLLKTLNVIKEDPLFIMKSEYLIYY